MSDESNNVIDFAQKKLENSPHLTGNAVCMACLHEWAVVCPLGVYEFECPKCGCLKGVPKTYIAPKGEVWVCKCGNAFMYIKSGGRVMCANCGFYHEGWL